MARTEGSRGRSGKGSTSPRKDAARDARDDGEHGATPSTGDDGFDEWWAAITADYAAWAASWWATPAELAAEWAAWDAARIIWYDPTYGPPDYDPPTGFRWATTDEWAARIAAARSRRDASADDGTSSAG